ncbi:hypothetical protein LPJ78_004466 [Coemansia sp. RSA 989]|nr:hypothetical protein LPJ68_002345 [Coemansia sp. RSA 1086]KAJ1749973.1 hypothetical protein LPJ79_003293 [Coemansia sp. RSA 1821]KAJ1862822.1 hypothetical protein LPJ78_004466 [Coemansia sp. RSA 989]KAJ2649825.1 hypothetical protein IWW40_002836 [Coemansia sp. RSA 1250]KAJ2672583.1 hypothetical protein IWW42_002737 [Coemansia sp. RSA 1085]
MALRAAASLVVTAPRAALRGRAASQASAFDYGVLMVRRRSGGAFGSAWVFPGGVIEPADRLCPHPPSACAIRETFEETGLLLTDAPVLSAGRLDPQRLQEAAQRSPLLGTQPLARWVTPRAQRKRFDTCFLLLNLTDQLLLDRLHAEQLQTSEVVELDWFAPDQLLLANRMLPLYPPQLHLLFQLARFSKQSELCEAGRLGGCWDAVEPVLACRDDGKVVALLPGDYAYSLAQPQVPQQHLYRDKPGPLHRLEMTPTAGGFLDAQLFQSNLSSRL